MRLPIFCFLLCWPGAFAQAQPAPAKKILTVEGVAGQTVRVDEIYYSLSSLGQAARTLRGLDAFLAGDSTRLRPEGDRGSLFPAAGACGQADSILDDWLARHNSEAELVEQELFDEIGVPAAAGRTLLKIKSPVAFKSLLARLETCPCFVGELVRADYSRPEALQHQLTLDALRDAKRKAGEMLALFGHRVKAVYYIAPARVDWSGAALPADENGSPFDPRLDRSLEIRCRVQVSVQFRYK